MECGADPVPAQGLGGTWVWVEGEAEGRGGPPDQALPPCSVSPCFTLTLCLLALWGFSFVLFV